MPNKATTVALTEVADVLAEHGDLLCALAVEKAGDGAVRIVVEVPAYSYCGAGLSPLELFYALQRVQDIGQMRAFAERYGIEPAALEALVAKGKEAS